MQQPVRRLLVMQSSSGTCFRGQDFHQFLILRALKAHDRSVPRRYSVPTRFLPAPTVSPGMSGQMQAILFRFRIEFAEWLGARTAFVAADADADDRGCCGFNSAAL